MHQGSLRVLHLIFRNGNSGSRANNQAITQQRSQKGKLKSERQCPNIDKNIKPNVKLKSGNPIKRTGEVVGCIIGLITSR